MAYAINEIHVETDGADGIAGVIEWFEVGEKPTLEAAIRKIEKDISKKLEDLGNGYYKVAGCEDTIQIQWLIEEVAQNTN
jgi:hypothetical protein